MEVPVMRLLQFVVCLCALVTAVSGPAAAQPAAPEVPDPSAFFGFEPGADRSLLDYGQLVDYLEAAADASPRVTVREIARTTLDRPMVLVFVSSEANIERLDELRAVNRRLALDPAIPEAERADLVERGRVFILGTLSMHSTEVAPAQSLPLLVHRLATAEDEETLGWLDNVVLMVVACLNPDGMDMVVEHYREELGTPYEGGSMPGLYHHYVGHDNNRDYVALNLAESRALNRVYSTEWFPQLHLDKHQMGRTGPRYFVPRYHDPIAENIDAKLWVWSDVFGSAMARAIGDAGLSGVASNWTFDEYWPGASTTDHWKGVISLLTEAASCRVATPVYVEPNERRVWGKGLSEYEKSVNMPDPWPGGWWRLGDIVDYELASWRGAIATAAMLREELLTFRNDLCREEVDRGRTEPPFYYVVPTDQHDVSTRDELVSLLLEHGVEVAELTGPTEIAGHRFAAGDVVVPLAQPFRPFVKEVMEAQRYPVRHYTPGGETIRPYDITSWSLPLHLGVTAIEVDVRSEELEGLLRPATAPATSTPTVGAWGFALDPRDNATYAAIFEALGSGATVLRTSAPMTLDGVELPAGAFLVHEPGDTVIEAVGTARAHALDTEPEVDRRPLAQSRIALVESWFHHMDGGWTRLLFERNGIEYTLLRPGDIPDTDLAARFDVVVFPAEDPDILREGKRKNGDEYRISDYRPEYREGLGDDGMERIEAFLEAGGRIVAWGESTGLFLEPFTFGEGDDALELELPVRDDSETLDDRGLRVPGSMLAVELLPDHPLTLGMPATTGVFSEGRPVLGTELPTLITDRRVIARFPDGDEDILLSGFAEKAELLAGRPALVWARAGRGQLVLFGFQPQFRASTPATSKLLFNALLLPEVRTSEAGVAGSS